MQTVRIRNHGKVDQIVYDRAFDPMILKPGDTVQGEFFADKTKGLTITKVKTSGGDDGKKTKGKE